MATSRAAKRILICIAGTTGVGKSDLGISLARLINGEIINADAMQVYKGMDIATNKIADTRGVPHHLMSFVDPSEQYVVGQFVTQACMKIDEILARDKVPILVGGSHYYIQSLLWHQSIISETADDVDIGPHASIPANIAILIKDLLAKSTGNIFEELDADSKVLVSHDMHNLLSSIDHAMAAKWHPNDRRKIRRSLEIYYTYGKMHSEINKEQQLDKLELHGLRLTLYIISQRYRTLLFWLYAKPESLDVRLDGRVDGMLERGLFDEVVAMRGLCINGKVLGSSSAKIDYTRGLLQSIEFDEYLENSKRLPETVVETAIFKKAVEQMKLATRQYARSQIKWIRNKLLSKCLESKDHMSSFILDATEAMARSISLAFIKHSPIPDASAVYPGYAEMVDSICKTQEWKKYTCDTCIVRQPRKKKNEEQLEIIAPVQRTFYGENEWKVHSRSQQHRKNAKSINS